MPASRSANRPPHAHGIGAVQVAQFPPARLRRPRDSHAHPLGPDESGLIDAFDHDVGDRVRRAQHRDRLAVELQRPRSHVAGQTQVGWSVREALTQGERRADPTLGQLPV